MEISEIIKIIAYGVKNYRDNEVGNTFSLLLVYYTF